MILLAPDSAVVPAGMVVVAGALDVADGDWVWAAINETAVSWTMKSATTKSAGATRDLFTYNLRPCVILCSRTRDLAQQAIAARIVPLRIGDVNAMNLL